MIGSLLDVRDQFPILQRKVHNCRLAYLDSAATTQKPQQVLSAIAHYYQHSNANIHRGVHTLSEEATHQFEAGRQRLGQWIGAAYPEEEIIVTKGATEAINLIAHGLQSMLKPGDEILISNLEHHANIVPWQQVAIKTGAKIKTIPIDDLGNLDQNAYQALLSTKTQVVAVNGISNALGTINPIAEMAAAAHAVGARLVCDATQMAPHQAIDVVTLDCDFLAMSGHKMYGPTGIGLCYGKKAGLAALDLYQTGGEMIEDVTMGASTFKAPPYCFEAGTPNIAGMMGWVAAVNFIDAIGFDKIAEHEQALLAQLEQGLDGIQGIKRYNNATRRTALSSFEVAGCHPQDLAILLDTFGIAVRSGHHCTMPLMKRLAVSGLVRASLGVYSCSEDIEQLLQALPKVIKMLKQ